MSGDTPVSSDEKPRSVPGERERSVPRRKEWRALEDSPNRGGEKPCISLPGILIGPIPPRVIHLIESNLRAGGAV